VLTVESNHISPAVGLVGDVGDTVAAVVSKVPVESGNVIVLSKFVFGAVIVTVPEPEE
jgi:hypothetical protein